MRILIADDDDISRLALEVILSKRGHWVTAAADGAEAWQVLQAPDPPPLVILDWMMPGLDGLEVCRRVRSNPKLRALYLILLTARGGREHVIEGLRAGAHDYVTKPFDLEELEARVNVGVRTLELQEELAIRVRDLEAALTRVKQLQGLLPICCYCKSIRDDQNYWHEVDAYLSTQTNAKLSHGVCPDCWDKNVQPQMTNLQTPSIGLPALGAAS